jgi:hypothetical protein
MAEGVGGQGVEEAGRTPTWLRCPPHPLRIEGF